MVGRRYQFVSSLGGMVVVCAGLIMLAMFVPAEEADARPPCPADCGVVDEQVTVEDLVVLMAGWGGPGNCDVDGDGFIGSSDLLDLLGAWGLCPINPGCGQLKSGSCYTISISPGCDDQTCCDKVCNEDPTCCYAGWSQQCLDIALELCGQCGEAAAGPCCVANGSPGCEVGTCCVGVCSADAFCCNVEWDALCVDSASTVCDVCRP